MGNLQEEIAVYHVQLFVLNQELDKERDFGTSLSAVLLSGQVETEASYFLNRNNLQVHLNHFLGFAEGNYFLLGNLEVITDHEAEEVAGQPLDQVVFIVVYFLSLVLRGFQDSLEHYQQPLHVLLVPEETVEHLVDLNLLVQVPLVVPLEDVLRFVEKINLVHHVKIGGSHQPFEHAH